MVEQVVLPQLFALSSTSGVNQQCVVIFTKHWVGGGGTLAACGHHGVAACLLPACLQIWTSTLQPWEQAVSTYSH